jgi:hypothetical protein
MGDPIDPVFIGKWIICTRLPQAPQKKTATYLVLAKGREATLGEIRWYGPWRKYALFPAPQRVFESTCLRELAFVCMELTTQHRRAQPRKGTVPV